jgi:hypothetical protein
VPRPADRGRGGSARRRWPATGRNRNPRCSQVCSRDGPRHPGMSEYRMRRRCGVRPACGPGRAREARASTRRGQFRSRWGNPWGSNPPARTPFRPGSSPFIASPLPYRQPCGLLSAVRQRTCRLLVAVAQDQPRHRVGCLGVQAGQHVALGIHRDGDVGMPQPLADHLGRDAGCQRGGCVAVANVGAGSWGARPSRACCSNHLEKRSGVDGAAVGPA